MKRLPGIHEIGIQFAGVDCLKGAAAGGADLPLPDGWYSDHYSGRVVMPQNGDMSMPLFLASMPAASAPVLRCTVPIVSVPIRCSTCWFSASRPAILRSKISKAAALIAICRRMFADAPWRASVAWTTARAVPR
jgi:hypothetical protein